jgi:PIN domain nuclease of toxin-antitoxin system
MNNYLLDTHALLWVFDDNPTISSNAREAMNQADIIYASLVSVWEIVIKKALGKLEVTDDLEQAIIKTGVRQLPITLAHILAVGDLPLEQHKDPFDRLLVAQAKVEGLTLITRDVHLGNYGVPIIAA